MILNPYEIDLSEVHVEGKTNNDILIELPSSQENRKTRFGNKIIYKRLISKGIDSKYDIVVESLPFRFLDPNIIIKWTYLSSIYKDYMNIELFDTRHNITKDHIVIQNFLNKIQNEDYYLIRDDSMQRATELSFGSFIGMIRITDFRYKNRMYLYLDDFIFIPPYRRKKIGHDIIRLLTELKLPIVISLSLNNDKLGNISKLINSYKTLGFEYHQEYLSLNDDKILMSNAPFDKKEIINFDKITKIEDFDNHLNLAIKDGKDILAKRLFMHGDLEKMLDYARWNKD